MRQFQLVLLALGLALLSCTGIACGPTNAEVIVPEGAVLLRGAGATFPSPLYEKWIDEYRRVAPHVYIVYDAVGSGEGVDRFVAGEVEFGASDAAMKDEEIAAVRRGVQLIPATAGSVVLAYNLPGIDGELRLPRDVYVDIFLGKIDQWNDPRLVEANPERKLPDLAVAVVARLDSSGTTFAFTNHLIEISEAWRETGPGRGKVVDWPGAAMLARGNEGVAGLIKRTPGAIGYVEFGMADRTRLAMATLENKAGNFIRPDGSSGMATLVHAKLPDNLRAFFPDPEGDNSYPIVTFSWLLLYRQYDDATKGDELKRFVRWCLIEGQQYAEPLGYIQLARPISERGMYALDGIR